MTNWPNEKWREYRKSAKGKDAQKARNQSEAGKASRAKYLASPKGKAATKKKSDQRMAIIAAKNAELIYSLKSKPCADCKQSFPTACMDFHHFQGEKRFSIGRAASQRRR